MMQAEVEGIEHDHASAHQLVCGGEGELSRQRSFHGRMAITNFSFSSSEKSSS